MKRTAALLVVVAAAASCRSPEIPDRTPAAVHGKIEGVQKIAKDATVQVYRVDGAGLATPDPFETVKLDSLGRFTTRVLSPGRYRLVYRSLEAPPSITAANVPLDTHVVLRPVVQAGLVQLRARSNGDAVTCRLTECKPADGIPDVREFTCDSRSTLVLRGLRRGLWTLDVPATGDTTEVEVSGGDDLRDLLVDPPAPTTGASISGVVHRLDGTPAPWMAVTVRPLAASGASATRWGRFATTDLSGAYRIVGIPPGTSLVRVECRESPARILPSAQVLEIPPSGTVQLGFVVEP